MPRERWHYSTPAPFYENEMYAVAIDAISKSGVFHVTRGDQLAGRLWLITTEKRQENSQIEVVLDEVGMTVDIIDAPSVPDLGQGNANYRNEIADKIGQIILKEFFSRHASPYESNYQVCQPSCQDA